ncbi:TolC family protein [Sphingomonas sp.]|uniref:TolC family protein n=1 Tax=Sphingomonas sp. TaxID=28214 RepID=UPI00286C50D4|nr:TolC family protein [Sphingomonas sp.]
MIGAALSGAILLASIGIALPARADPLTFEEAISRAQENAPSLRARALGADASRAARAAAGALPDPKLSLGVDSFPISGPLAFQPSRDNFTWVRIGISQDIPNPAKRRAQRTRADADIAVAEAGTVLEARTVEVDTAIAWITLAYAQKRLAVVEAVRPKLDRLVRTTPSAVAAGNARPGQTLAGRQSIAELDDRLDELNADVGRARAELTRWTGDPAPQIAGPVPDFAVNEATLRASIDTNPLLGPPQARIAQAAADVRLAEADRQSDFGVEAAYQHRDPRFGDYVSAGVTVSLPFFTRRRQGAAIAVRQAEANKVDAEREAARRELAANLEAGLADHTMHHEQWMRSRRTIEPLARERVDLETASYGAGRATLIDVVDAHIALVAATLTTLDREALVEIDGARLTLTYRSATR